MIAAHAGDSEGMDQAPPAGRLDATAAGSIRSRWPSRGNGQSRSRRTSAAPTRRASRRSYAARPAYRTSSL